MKASSSSDETSFASQSIAPINLTGGAGDTLVIAGTAGKRIVILYGWLAAGATATSYLLKDGSPRTGVVTLPANQSHEFVPPNGVAALKFGVAGGVTITKGAGALDGWFIYTVIQGQADV